LHQPILARYRLGPSVEQEVVLHNLKDQSKTRVWVIGFFTCFILIAVCIKEAREEAKWHKPFRMLPPNRSIVRPQRAGGAAVGWEFHLPGRKPKKSVRGNHSISISENPNGIFS